jgi:hypothetical protein
MFDLSAAHFATKLSDKKPIYNAMKRRTDSEPRFTDLRVLQAPAARDSQIQSENGSAHVVL